MPFAPKIRKDILHAIEHHTLPALQAQKVTQLFAGPPFDFSGVKHRVIREELLPDNDKGPLQVIRQWPDLQMVASRGTNISFLYEGAMHKKVGVLAGMGKAVESQGLPVPSGIYVLEISAPCIVLEPSFVAREDGTPCTLQNQDVSKTMSVTFDRDEVSMFHSSRNFENRTSSHHLSIQDSLLTQLGQIYLEELQQKVNLPGAQALLLALMFRLHYHLTHNSPGISNSCWLDPVHEFEKTLSATELRHQELCRNVIDYVQNHLHEPLSIEMISKRFHVSAFHLNRVFRQVQGTTVMHYVTELRLNVAKKILIGQNERINDIARLTGFSGTTSFCTVFRRHTGKTPSQFRRQHR